jgi:hypothetical protein
VLELRCARLWRGAALAECSLLMRGLAHNQRSGERTASSLQHPYHQHQHHTRDIETESRLRTDPRCVCVCGGWQVSSANYVARSFGIRASMSMQQARQLCAQVVAVPYEFDKYTAAAEKMYRVLFDTSPHVQVGVRPRKHIFSVRNAGDAWGDCEFPSGRRFGFRIPAVRTLAHSVQQDGAFTWRECLTE